MANLIKISYPLLELIFVLKHQNYSKVKKLNYKFGTLLVKSDFEPSQALIIKVQSIFNIGARAIVIVYDITSYESYNDATKYWFNEIKLTCKNGTQIILVGNKCDLVNQR